jgi:Fic family protein
VPLAVDTGRCRCLTLKGWTATMAMNLQSGLTNEGMGMARLVERRWEGSPGAPGGRRARASFTYRAFVPDLISGLAPSVSFQTAGAATDAERAIRELNARASTAGLEAIGPLLLRSEAVASSRIEGYQVSTLNLARALVDPRVARGSARPVAANVGAMEAAIARADDPSQIRVEDIEAIHRVLMAQEPRATPGRVREVQNWLGGRLDSPLNADFVPPPEDQLAGLLDDLCRFLERDDLPPVAQAAIAHAQFETIHPFIDGNGRVGRCLVHAVLRQAGVAPRFVPPVSIVMAARPSSYVAGLIGFREGRVAEWVESFANACRVAAIHAAALADEVASLQREWTQRAGRPRAGSAAARMIALLPAQPVMSAPTIRTSIGTSQQQALEGLKALAAAGVVRQISEGSYDRQFAATELFDLVTAYEERIAGRLRGS